MRPANNGMAKDEPRLRILVLGNSCAPEMQGVMHAVRTKAAKADLKLLPAVRGTIDLVNGRNWHPDFVVVLQTWPVEFTANEVHQLYQLCPLARVICCFGAWCESDGRNRSIWPLAVRVAARAAAPRICRELDVLTRTARLLPPTATRDEVFAFDCPGTLSSALTQETVLVRSPDVALKRWLEQLLSTSGYGIVREDDFGKSAAIVWDVDPWNAVTAAALRESSLRIPAIPIIALISLAHPEDVDAIKARGASAVVAKLAPHSELIAALQAGLTANNQTGTFSSTKNCC